MGEFNHYFLSRVEEGLSASQEERMEEEPGENMQLGGSFKSRHSMIRESSQISKLFFGKFRQRMEYMVKGEMEEKERTEMFNLISVDVRSRNLYDGWEAQLVEEIEDYKNDKDETVKAQKYNWILEAPESLYFQIQRVEYNKDTRMRLIS